MAFLPLVSSFTTVNSTQRKRPRTCHRRRVFTPPCSCISEDREQSVRQQLSSSLSNENISNSSKSQTNIEAILKIHTSIHDFSAEEWDNLANCGSANPFLRHHFLASLEDSRCVCVETGWIPRHISIRNNDQLLAVIPAYVKTHSMGEFVFDSSWAEASYAWGRPYYPKLLIAPPFTPATGRRILTSPIIDNFGRRPELLKIIANSLIDLCDTMGVSGAHCNFCESDEADALESAGFMRRLGVQYHFVNEKRVNGVSQKFSDFNDYLAEFRSKRRSNIRRERKAVREHSGLNIEIVQGADIDVELMEQMFWIYKSTIDKMYYGRQYLNIDLFRRLAQCDAFKETLCFVVARRQHDNKIIAGTVNVIGDKSGVFFGRYWGNREEHKYLHFETCYYAAIEYVIENGLTRMEPGAGGGKFFHSIRCSTVQSVY